MTNSIQVQATHTNTHQNAVSLKTQAGSTAGDISKSKKDTVKVVKALKEAEQDFEFYPTTHEIIECVKADIIRTKNIKEGYPIVLSVLDCGAGDGRVLEALTQGNRYAIEKSELLRSQYSHEIFIVGTDFTHQTLLDKKVSVIFSNPPYLEFVSWAVKIITEANAPYAYLVLPSRWADNSAISDALAARECQVNVIGCYDFLEADRQARAKVDVIRIDFTYRRSSYNSIQLKVDPFSLWFSTFFKFGSALSEATENTLNLNPKKDSPERNELIKNEGLVNVLEQFFNRDLDNLMSNYLKLSELDPVLLDELGVKVTGVQEALELKITSLKSMYWRELFDNLTTVTEKLTYKSRTTLLDTLLKHTHVDFSAANMHAVVIWVIKNSNEYFDSQLVDIVDRMTEKANVMLYKSNKKTFGDECWRYARAIDELDHYLLDYRIVLSRIGGLACSPWTWENPLSGLSAPAAVFLDDLCTVASNIGFDTHSQPKAATFPWDTNIKNQFLFMNHSTGIEEVLFEAKAFKNGNLHLKLNQRFICRLNVEFGRLKGWLKTAEQAADEMQSPIESVREHFSTNYQLKDLSLPLLLVG